MNFQLQDDVQLPVSSASNGKRGSKYVPDGLIESLQKANIGQGLLLPFLPEGAHKGGPKRQKVATEWQINDHMKRLKEEGKEPLQFACGIVEGNEDAAKNGILVKRVK